MKTMPLVRPTGSPLVLRLNRDLTRTIKRGHPWVYADALRDLPRAPSGSPAVLLDNRQGRPLATGFYDPRSPLAFRVCDAEGETPCDDAWAARRLQNALDLRRSLFDEQTTGYRLLNGEGDGMPGMVVDIYGDTAVLKFDGAGPLGFWNADGIAEWLAHEAGVQCIYERQKERGREGKTLIGQTPRQAVPFFERGLQFTADVVHGQKTGFFLDQRDNRHLIRGLARDRTVLNLFAYTGGFSVAAGRGGARHVTSVDLAKPAVQTADIHWRLNELPQSLHDALAADAFEFLADAASRRQRWNLTIVDPPSFAPSQDSVSKASAAYKSLIAGAARVTTRGGIVAAASCSSHIDFPLFLTLCEEAISEARRRGTILEIRGQPADHPSPLALPEFRYLKFVLLRIE